MAREKMLEGIKINNKTQIMWIHWITTTIMKFIMSAETERSYSEQNLASSMFAFFIFTCTK